MLREDVTPISEDPYHLWLFSKILPWCPLHSDCILAFRGSKVLTSSTKIFGGRSEIQDGLWLAETFSTSPLKPLNGMEFNEIWQETRSQRPLSIMCLGPLEKQYIRPASDWLRHSQFLLWNCLTDIKKRLLLRCIHHFNSDLINNMDHMRISGNEPSSVILRQNLTVSKMSMSSTNFVFFGPIRKPKWQP